MQLFSEPMTEQMMAMVMTVAAPLPNRMPITS